MRSEKAIPRPARAVPGPPHHNRISKNYRRPLQRHTGSREVLQISRATDTTPNSPWTLLIGPTKHGQPSKRGAAPPASALGVTLNNRCVPARSAPRLRKSQGCTRLPVRMRRPPALSPAPWEPRRLNWPPCACVFAVAGLFPTPPGNHDSQVCRRPSRKLPLTELGLAKIKRAIKRGSGADLVRRWPNGDRDCTRAIDPEPDPGLFLGCRVRSLGPGSPSHPGGSRRPRRRLGGAAGAARRRVRWAGGDWVVLGDTAALLG